MTTLENSRGGSAPRRATCNCGQLSVTYDGPDPARISLCQCYSCQRHTGSVLSVQTRLPREHVTIEGESKAWQFPESGKPPAAFRSCDSGGAAYHFCPECGSTVYADLDIAPDFLLVHVGNFTDPTFPAPIISAFEAVGAPWVTNMVSNVPMKGGHLDYDGTTHGGPRV
ncbi:MAG TPA: GFA family protein [Propionibacteriaceae bacterium]|nr:GFA family protein [Propionibacteriaceae bacterium]